MQFVVTASLQSLKLFVKSLLCLHRVSPHLLLVATATDVRQTRFSAVDFDLHAQHNSRKSTFLNRLLSLSLSPGQLKLCALSESGTSYCQMSFASTFFHSFQVLAVKKECTVSLKVSAPCFHKRPSNQRGTIRFRRVSLCFGRSPPSRSAKCASTVPSRTSCSTSRASPTPRRCDRDHACARTPLSLA